MGILLDENSRILVQGITGREGSFHARTGMAYGTNVVAGVTPGRGGQLFDDQVPVFNSVEEAVAETGANVSLIFVPPPFAPDAIVEAADAGVPLIACITEGVPVQDMAKVARYLERKPEVRLIGPNCPGMINPGARCKVGIMPGNIHLPGRVGVVSRSGTLTYEAVQQLTNLGIGQSSCVGIGGDPIIGTSFAEILRLYNEDPDTDLIVFIGEIGGTMEQEAAAYIKDGGNQAGVHSDSGSHRAAGQAHGPRRGYHHRRQRPGRGQDCGDAGGRRAYYPHPGGHRVNGAGGVEAEMG